MLEFLLGLFVLFNCLFVCQFACLSASQSASFTSFWSAVTLCRYMNCQYNDSIHRKEQLAS